MQACEDAVRASHCLRCQHVTQQQQLARRMSSCILWRLIAGNQSDTPSADAELSTGPHLLDAVQCTDVVQGVQSRRQPAVQTEHLRPRAANVKHMLNLSMAVPVMIVARVRGYPGTCSRLELQQTGASRLTCRSQVRGSHGLPPACSCRTTTERTWFSTSAVSGR